MNEYWVVTDNRTGKVICHCADINDAIMMVNFDPHYRSYSRHRLLMDQVINVTSTTDKQLPGQLGLPAGQVNQLEPHKIKLPEGQQQPVKI
jgi:hypothetical protein